MTNHPIEPHPVLEKVARAIWEELSRRYSVDDVECAGAARAALEALRDLPEDVIAAGERAAWDDHNHMPAIRAMPRAVAAMINHITGEPDA